MHSPSDFLGKLFIGGEHNQSIIRSLDVDYSFERVDLHCSFVFMIDEIDYLILVLRYELA